MLFLTMDSLCSVSAPDHNSTEAGDVLLCSHSSRATLPWMKTLLLTFASSSTGNCLSNSIFSLAAASLQLQTSYPYMPLALIMSMSTIVMGKDYNFWHFFTEIKPLTHFISITQFILKSLSAAFYQIAMLFLGNVLLTSHFPSKGRLT